MVLLGFSTRATGWLSQFKSHVEDRLFPLITKPNCPLPPGFFLSNCYISPLADPGALLANVPLKSTKICTFPVKKQNLAAFMKESVLKRLEMHEEVKSEDN